MLAIIYTIISSLVNRGDPSNMFEKNNRCLQSRTDGMHVEEVEVAMKEDMPNCSFFGADPVKEPNQDMFETVGVFYHIAVGGKNGTSLATVLEPDTRSYRIREVNHVDIATFLGRFIRKQYIDNLMIDIEWEEYDVLPFLVKSGDLENSDVVLCQINVEIHHPDYEQKVLFFEFFLELLDDRRYIPLVADTMLGHIRLYLLNYEHQECRRRYVSP
nr:Protein of unknown function DUF13 domain containing protein [Haemonchus contortus]